MSALAAQAARLNAANTGAGGLDGAVLRLVVEGHEFNAHIEQVTTGVLRDRKRLGGRSR